MPTTPFAPDERFSGISRLYGAEGAKRLRNAHACVVGLGGVGSWTVEALARSGVGYLTLVDLDDICISNTNRQLHALTSTIGQQKTEALVARARDINPSVRIETVEDFLTPNTVKDVLSDDFDVVVDAIDQFRNKCALLEEARLLEIDVVVVGGAGGRRDPTKVSVADMTQARGDRLLAMTRKRLRQRAGFPRKDQWGVPCVFSDERPVYPVGDGTVCETKPDSDSMRLDCASGYGSATMVTGTFGFFAAAAAIDLVLRTPR